MAKGKLTPQQELCQAIWEGWELEKIAEIISRINNLDYLDDYGKSPLYLAVEKGNEGSIKLLCQGGASPDLSNRDSEATPRKLAAEKAVDMDLFNISSSSRESIVAEPVVAIEEIGLIKIDLYAAFGGKENFLERFGQGGVVDVSVDTTGMSSNAENEDPDAQ